MKRRVLLIFAATMAAGVMHAQEAFKQLSASLEAGTTGIGINVSVPVITDRLIFSAGYNFPSFSYKQNIDVGNGYVNQQIALVKDAADIYDKTTDVINALTNSQLPHIGDDVRKIDKLSADVEGKLNFGNLKLMFQYYPTTKSNFYVSAGVFIGSGEMGSIDGTIDRNVWNVYLKAVETNNQLRRIDPEFYATIKEITGYDIGPVDELERAVRFNVGNQTFHIHPEDDGHIKAKLKVNKVKPYLGIGFGNAVPENHRFGFQMEVGAYYQSKPVIESSQEEPYDIEAIWQKDLADTKDMVQKLTWFPQLTFRLTGRIF